MEQGAFYRDRRIRILLAALCTFLWGCAIPAVKTGYRLFAIGSDDVGSQLLFAGVRFFAAGVVTLLAAAIGQRRFPTLPKRVVPGAIALGLLQTGLQYLLFYIGLAHTSGVRGAILNATSTFFTVLLSGILWREKDRLTLRKLLGCAAGFLGVLLVNLGGLSAEPFTFLGDGFVLLSSLSLAVGSALTKVCAHGTDSVSLTGWQLSIGGFALLVAGALMGGRLEGIFSWQGLLLMAFMVMISSVAFSIFTNLLKYNPVSRVSIYNFLIPVFGVMLSALVLGEGFPGLSALAALALVCLGILLVNFGDRRSADI